MMKTTFDAVIVGAGPGGYVAAIRAAQLGFEVALVEKNATLGGTCLNVGCIPSKALLDSSELFAMAAHDFAAHGIDVGEPKIDVSRMIARKRKVVEELTRGIAMLMKKNGVTVVRGRAKLVGGMRVAVATDDGEIELEARKNVLLATGSVPVELPFARFDGQVVVSSTEALEFERVPEHLVVVGAGFIGLELGSVWRRLGARVTVVEMLPKLLPMMDDEVSDALTRTLRKQGLEFELGARLENVRVADGRASVELTKADSTRATIACDKVLVAVGRRPFTDGLGLDVAGVQIDERRRVKIDDQFRTTAPGISAIGDLVRGPMLAHKAEEEGVAWAEILAGQPGHVNYDAIPGVVYTWPEAAYVGMTEREARARHGDVVKVGKFAFAANGRAKAAGEREGFVKVIAGPRGRLLGLHIFGPRASELIAEAVLAMEFGATAEDIARTCHAHPTLAEAVKEAALAAEGRVIHS
ncbi:MAG: dihydrolipoyl dehydrogenase [Candidatus Sumerlaeaceae bacterium]|jgi:dihydrolipoamide dehydrogenase